MFQNYQNYLCVVKKKYKEYQNKGQQGLNNKFGDKNKMIRALKIDDMAKFCSSEQLSKITFQRLLLLIHYLP